MCLNIEPPCCCVLLFFLASSLPHLSHSLASGLRSTSCTLTSLSVISPPQNVSTPSNSNSPAMSETESFHPQATDTFTNAPGNIWENKSKSWASVVSKQPGYNHTPIANSTLYKMDGSKDTGDLFSAVKLGVSSSEQLDMVDRNPHLNELAGTCMWN